MKLRIAILTDQYPSREFPDRGSFIKDLVDHLRSARVDVTVIDHRMNFAAMSLECMIRSPSVDIIDAQFLAPSGVVAAVTPRAAPLVITVHRWDILEFPQRWPLAQMTTRYALASAKGIIVAGSAILGDVRKFAPRNSNIAVIPNAVDTERFRPDVDTEPLRRQLSISDDAKVILATGHLIERKGFEYLIKAMPTIVEHFSPCCLVIVGDGYLRNELLGLVAKLHLHDTIKLVGAISYDKMHYYYALADIFVMPSLSEGHSLSILEAMSAGKPIIASAIPANTISVIPNFNGFLVPAKNPQAISSCALSLLTNQELSDRFARNSREKTISEFSWNIRLKRLLKFYESILN